MPRLHPSLLRKAYSIEPYVARLLLVCRDIRSAQNELRWIREHAKSRVSKSPDLNNNHLVHNYVMRRCAGEPLQYILGSEFFGDLEIKCRPGVLIPRQETANSVTHLVKLLSSNTRSLPRTLRVLDLCTGTGCIPLLFHHKFYSRQSGTKNDAEIYLDITGIDISARAIKLAEQNRALQLASLHRESSVETTQLNSLRSTALLRADVLNYNGIVSPRGASSLLHALQGQEMNGASPSNDILISNPPYISSSDYYRTTSPSVRRFEPKLALVPPPLSEDARIAHDGDFFYSRIIRAAHELGTQILLMEVADFQQAERVASLLMNQGTWDGIGIWRDNPSSGANCPASEFVSKDNTRAQTIPILGAGNARSVLAFRGRGQEWL